MKARIQNKFDKKTINELNAYVTQKVEKDKNEEMMRFLKLICVTLHKDFNFGGKRLARLLINTEELLKENYNNEVLWDRVDELLIEKLGLDFKRENYEERERAIRESVNKK